MICKDQACWSAVGAKVGLLHRFICWYVWIGSLIHSVIAPIFPFDSNLQHYLSRSLCWIIRGQVNMSFCCGENARFEQISCTLRQFLCSTIEVSTYSGFTIDWYALARRNCKNCLPSPEFVLFRKKKNRAGTLCTKVDQIFGKEAVVAGLLDGFRRLRFFDRLQTIDADAASGTAAGHRRNAHP
jgi:hypothetical protein